jgi:hypothetical protein
VVGVHHAAGQEQGVVFVGAGVLQRGVDGELVPPLGVIPALYLAFGGRDDVGLGTGFL